MPCITPEAIHNFIGHSTCTENNKTNKAGKADCNQSKSIVQNRLCPIFTVRRYAGTVYAVALCLSVTSHSSFKTAKQRIMQTMPHHRGTLFSDAKDLG